MPILRGMDSLSLRLKGGRQQLYTGWKKEADGSVAVGHDLFGMDALMLNHMPSDVMANIDDEEMARLAPLHAEMSEQVRMTQMFLVLQNERIERCFMPPPSLSIPPLSLDPGLKS